MRLNRRVLAACRVASVDKTRPLLQGVLLTGKEAVGTDGTVMVRVGLPKQDGEAEPVLLPAVELSRVVKSLHQHVDEFFAGPGQREGTMRIGVVGSLIVELEPISGKYPDYLDVWERSTGNEEVEFEIALGVDALIRLLGAHKAIGAGEVRLSFRGWNKGVEITSGSEDDGSLCQSVIMPWYDQGVKERWEARLAARKCGPTEAARGVKEKT